MVTPLQIDAGTGLDEYVRVGNETAQELLSGTNPLVATLRKFDDFFRNELWGHVNPTSPVAWLLFMNAYMLFLASVRTALSGHAAAVYPVIRVALESACYGVLIAHKPELADVWLNRHRDDKARAACRKAFTVSNAAAVVATMSEDFSQQITEAYDAAIDFGAHPNFKGVQNHLSVNSERADGNVHVSVIGLHSADGFETTRSLLACLEYCLLIVTTIALSTPGNYANLSDRLSTLNDLRRAETERLQKELSRE